MNAACAQRLAELRATMAAAVSVIADYGDSIVVRVVPDADEDELPSFELAIAPLATLTGGTRALTMSLQRDGARLPVRIIDAGHTRSIDVDALIDSGAACTVIDEAVAHDMGLLTDRRLKTTGAMIGVQAGIELLPFRLLLLGSGVSIDLPTGLAFADMAELARAEVLIGRDVLSKGVFVLDGPGNRATLSFAAR